MKIEASALNRILRTSLSNDSLNLIVMPTEACNFRCVYCYEDFKLGRMQPRVVAGIKNLLTQRASELTRLDLSWFGGEPLLALDIMEDVLEHVAELRRLHPAMHHESNLTTNAWKLTTGVFQRLLALGVRSYQISFDGPRELHDRKRVRADGGPTFDRIWRNVAALRDIDGSFNVIVRIHVDRENDAAMPAFIDQCVETFGSDARFEIFVRQLSRLGGPNDAALPILGPGGEERIDALRERVSARTGASAAAPAEASAPKVCYASRANSFVVRSDGRINKCTVALEHPANQVGMLHENGELEITSARVMGWMRGLKSRNPVELYCPMLGFAEPAPKTAAAS